MRSLGWTLIQHDECPANKGKLGHRHREGRWCKDKGRRWPFSFLYFFFFLRTTPVAYGGSRARGQIGAIEAHVCHSHGNARSEAHLQPMLQLVASWILNPLSEVRDWTSILRDTSRVHYHQASTGTPRWPCSSQGARPGVDPPTMALTRNQPRGHLDLGLSASRIVRWYISAVQAPSFCGTVIVPQAD